METDSVDLFRNVELAEPSAETDTRILALARRRPQMVQPARVRTAAAAALFLGVAAAWFAIRLLMQSSPEPAERTRSRPQQRVAAMRPKSPSPTRTAERTAQEELRSALAEIRGQLEEIDEMADLIPAGRKETRQAIEKRVRACLTDVSRLERRLGWGPQGRADGAGPESARKRHRTGST